MKLFLVRIIQSIPFSGVFFYQEAVARQFRIYLETQKYVSCLLSMISFLYIIQGVTYCVEGMQKYNTEAIGIVEAIRYLIVAFIQFGIAPYLFQRIENILQNPKEQTTIFRNKTL